jgi:hypothetical protein
MAFLEPGACGGGGDFGGAPQLDVADTRDDLDRRAGRWVGD